MDSTIANDERREFSVRLASAMRAIGCILSATALTREFNPRADGAAVSTQAARKWLRGEAIPTQERVHVLARWLRVSPEWLRFGDGSEAHGSANDAVNLPLDHIVLLNNFQRLDERSQSVVNDLVLSLLKHHSLRT
jgi:hypothetical protein